jgi:hypothetical protein
VLLRPTRLAVFATMPLMEPSVLRDRLVAGLATLLLIAVLLGIALGLASLLNDHPLATHCRQGLNDGAWYCKSAD